MSREPKKPKQDKAKKSVNMGGAPTAAVQAESQPHNVKKEALGPNIDRK